MARNQEKAQSMLNRWVTYKRMMNTGKQPLGRRPALASECTNLNDGEKWRMDIIREIGRKIVDIQNESLGEQRLRDLNDEINKLIREKAHWERRILELGGPNYRNLERIADEETVDAEDAPDPEQKAAGVPYKYFGAAKNLPGVRELFLRKVQDAKRQRKYIDMRGIDAAYYGYNDEDSLLAELEKQAEKAALENALKQWEGSNQKSEDTLVTEFAAQEAAFSALVNLPSREEIEKILLEKRKESVLKKYLKEEELNGTKQEEKQQEDTILGKRKEQ